MIDRVDIATDSDGADEPVDLVDESDRVIGRVTRSEMRRDRLRHRAVFIAVTDGSGRLLVHRRSALKDIWPGWCDIAVGGVVSAGEGYEEAARRELAEEIGVDDVELLMLDDGVATAFDDESVSLIGRCFQIVHRGPFEFSDGEVDHAWWVDREELERALATDRFLPDSLALVRPRIRW